jgi:hypothetical protein
MVSFFGIEVGAVEMADVPNPGRRKTRTRQHIIADLGVNYVERQILLAGFTLERITRDYGIDLNMTTFSPNGQVENEFVWFQVKATDNLQLNADEAFATVRIESADFRYWLMQVMTVILVLFDVKNDRAFWLETQEYVKRVDMDADEIGETVSVRIPVSNLLTVESIRFIRDRKEAIVAEIIGLTKPDPSA